MTNEEIAKQLEEIRFHVTTAALRLQFLRTDIIDSKIQGHLGTVSLLQGAQDTLAGLDQIRLQPLAHALNS